MNKLILETQSNVLLKAQAEKEKSQLLKDAARYYKIKKHIISDYSYFLFSKGKGWLDNNPLELDKDAEIKDRVSKTFLKLVKLIDILRAVDDLDFLTPYLDALSERGINIDIFNDNKIEDRDYLDETLKLVKQQLLVIKNEEANLDEVGFVAEEEEFCTQKKFRNLTESYYKLNNDEKADKVKQKLLKELSENKLNSSGIEEIIDE